MMKKYYIPNNSISEVSQTLNSSQTANFNLIYCQIGMLVLSQKWDNVGKKLKIKSMVTIEFDINEWHYLVHSIVVPHNTIYIIKHIL